jgi:hypothetical protein
MGNNIGIGKEFGKMFRSSGDDSPYFPLTTNEIELGLGDGSIHRERHWQR